MTNVPDAGFVAFLAVTAVLFALPLLAGVSLLVARATGLRLEWSLLAVQAVAILGGVIVAGLTVPFGVETVSLPAAVGLARFAGGVLVVGLAVAGIAAGAPIAAGAGVAVLVGDLTWRRGVWDATVGYAGGGVVGALAGLAATGRIDVAAAGAVLAVPAALCGPGVERVVRSPRRPSA